MADNKMENELLLFYDTLIVAGLSLTTMMIMEIQQIKWKIHEERTH